MNEYTRTEQAAITRAMNIIAEKQPDQVTGEALNSPRIARDLIVLHLSREDQSREHFVCAFLNAQHGLVAIETIFSGTIDGAAVYPRVLAKRALELNASAVVLGHNHPSGEVTPSQADRRITKRINDGLGLLDIRVLDHIIVGGVKTYSFAESGEM